jgi:hypothetical protein
MKQTVNFSDFFDAFRSMGRENQFSYEGKRVLFDYLESLEEDTAEEIELDVIAFCCEYYESSYEDIAQDYRLDVEGLDEDELADTVRKYLEAETFIIGEVPGGFVYQVF